MTFQELLSKTLEKLNNIEIKSTITITLILHYFWLIIFPRKSFETFLAKKERKKEKKKGDLLSLVSVTIKTTVDMVSTTFILSFNNIQQ